MTSSQEESRGGSRSSTSRDSSTRRVFSQATWRPLTIYERFEQVVIFILINVMALVVVAAVWNLIVKVGSAIYESVPLDPTDHVVFQSIFGMIFTVIIALEFKRSVLVVAKRQYGVVQVRIIILIGMLAIVRKFIIIDLAVVQVETLYALAASVLALGIVYWLVRDQDSKERKAEMVESSRSKPA
jgi:uncharacterized membrane protein (DUF373 family)